MTLAEYEEAAMRTAGGHDLKVYAPMCIGEEAGEVIGVVKKHLFHGHELNRDKLCKELGDVLWYLTATAKAYGLTLEQVAAANVAKLLARYPSGFSSEASINRGEE